MTPRLNVDGKRLLRHAAKHLMGQWVDLMVEDAAERARELEPAIHVLVHKVQGQGVCPFCQHWACVRKALCT